MVVLVMNVAIAEHMTQTLAVVLLINGLTKKIGLFLSFFVVIILNEPEIN